MAHPFQCPHGLPPIHLDRSHLGILRRPLGRCLQKNKSRTTSHLQGQEAMPAPPPTKPGYGSLLCCPEKNLNHTVTLSTSLMDVSPPFSLSCGNSRSSNHCSHKHQGLTLLPNHYDNYLPVFSVKFDANKFWKTSVEDGRGTR